MFAGFAWSCKVHGMALVKEIENPKFTCTALNILISNCLEKAFPNINRYPEPSNLNCKNKTLQTQSLGLGPVETMIKQLGKNNQLQQSDLLCPWINNSPSCLEMQCFKTNILTQFLHSAYATSDVLLKSSCLMFSE